VKARTSPCLGRARTGTCVKQIRTFFSKHGHYRRVTVAYRVYALSPGATVAGPLLANGV